MDIEILFDPIVLEKYFINHKEYIDHIILEGKVREINEDTKNQYLKLIYDGMSYLSERQRSTIMLYSNGYAEREIAQILNISRSTVRVYIKRAIKGLKKTHSIKEIINKSMGE